MAMQQQLLLLDGAGIQDSFTYLHNEIIKYAEDNAQASPIKVEPLAAVEKLLYQVGFRTGQSFIERLTRDMIRFTTELDIIKFVCKDFWASVFGKQADSLKTNHQGVYVIGDNQFLFLKHVAKSTSNSEELVKFVHYTRGLICGALSSLNISSSVTVHLDTPSCQFNIKISQL